MLTLVTLGPSVAWGQAAWPSKTIHLVVPYAAGGFADIRARMLSTELAKKRLSVLPEVPNMAKAGVPGFESYNWQGLIAPAETPKEIIERLNREINAILAHPAIRDLISSTGSEIGGGTPEAFGALIRSETEKRGKAVRQAGIKPA